MVVINCPKVAVICKHFDGKEYDGILFKLQKCEGLRCFFTHSGDDSVAKSIVKREMAAIPELKLTVASCQIVDESGRLI